MINLAGTMHGGCAVYLIDVYVLDTHFRSRSSPRDPLLPRSAIASLRGLASLTCSSRCSSVAVMILAHVSGKSPYYVSQAINTTFHAPAPL